MRKLENFGEFTKNEGLISHAIGAAFGKNPRAGDYVLIIKNPHDNPNGRIDYLENFLYTNIGQVVKYQRDDFSDEHFWDNGYAITFENIPEDVMIHFKNDKEGNKVMYFKRDKIEHFSKNKEEMENILEERLSGSNSEKV